MTPAKISSETISTADKNAFAERHIGPREKDIQAMLTTLGYDSLDALSEKIIPDDIQFSETLALPDALPEAAALQRLQEIADKNKIFKDYRGLGYYPCHTPSVILRNLLENPQWYTPYTPYQAEIAQGRLEALMNFQTLITELSGMDIANASLLDEATAAAEAMILAYRALKRNDTRKTFAASENTHPQTLRVLETRATALGINLLIGKEDTLLANDDTFAVLLSYPDTFGAINDYRSFTKQAKQQDIRTVVATDLLALCLLEAPGNWGADIVIGNSQRFGMPMGFGGPHAAFFAGRDTDKRLFPGRIVGVSKDRQGRNAYRLSLQTREQHIRRDKATSNICTAQALPAMLTAMYAAYHGPAGLRQIAERVHRYTAQLQCSLQKAGYSLKNETFFDTISIELSSEAGKKIVADLRAREIALRHNSDYSSISISFNETTTPSDLSDLTDALGIALLDEKEAAAIPSELARTSNYLEQTVFNTLHSESEMMRYLDRLQQKDLGLNNSMIPLGSCTMKLNAATEMIPVTWPGFANIHPFADDEETAGYQKLTSDLSDWLAACTGFDAVSLQPNAGSQGEYAGLLAIKRFHESNGEGKRNICLIPLSAHGTNPASAIMAGFEVLGVACDEQGNVDLNALKKCCSENAAQIAALMITYPSTHGVFETAIRNICETVHEVGGQVYLDGANLNAQVGLCRPGDYGADVCHLNLHKTFCIPHGGGGPGMGPIGVAKHLIPYLPGNPIDPDAAGVVSAAPYGSGCILPISYLYIQMMGHTGLRKASQVAILNANYIASRLHEHYPVVYSGENDLVAHECIIDARAFKAFGIDVDDIAKRLMDYGFHAPTMSWPVPGTLMIEPTESEPKEEIDRFCDAMIAIRKEIKEIELGHADAEDNVLKYAPYTAEYIAQNDWPHGFSREAAAYPVESLRQNKYWPPVSRIDNVYGDRNLVCSCDPFFN